MLARLRCTRATKRSRADAIVPESDLSQQLAACVSGLTVRLIWVNRDSVLRQGDFELGAPVIRSELVQKLCDDFPDLTQKEIERVVASFYDSIIDQLQQGGRVELRGFGAFSTRGRDARRGRNPRTGEPVDVNAKRVPYFKPGKEMRERLNIETVTAD